MNLQQIQSQTKIPSASLEKQPSKLGILILALVTIALYGLDINEVNKTVSGMVEAAVGETLPD